MFCEKRTKKARFRATAGDKNETKNRAVEDWGQSIDLESCQSVWNE